MLQSNVPSVEVTSTGLSIPDTPSVLAGVLLDFRAAFGQELNIQSLSTPQGYLSQELAWLITQLHAKMAEIYAGVDPATSSGRMQDAIGRIYFITRKSGTPTTVECICTGQPGATLPAGSRAKDDAGNIFESVSTVYFNSGGLATVTFQAKTIGAIGVGVGELSQIAVAVPGWDAVTNTVPGVTGTSEENRTSFENRRSQSVAKNAHSTTSAIYANVIDLDGVIDVYVWDNSTNKDVVHGETDYPVMANSILVVVEGGKDEEIANAIWQKKDPGCSMNGNTTVTVVDTEYGGINKPSYDITFLRPTSTPIYFDVQIEKDNALPSNIIMLVKQRISDLLNGNYNNRQREVIDGTIYASRYYVAIQDLSDAVNIISITIGFNSDTGKNFLKLGVDQFPVVADETITVTLVGGGDEAV